MSELTELRKTVRDLSTRVKNLEENTPSLNHQIESANGDFICDVKAIAHLWGCSVETVQSGRAGTVMIKRIPGRRIRAKKRDVLAAIAKRDMPISEQAAAIIAAVKPRRRKTLIRRKVAGISK